MTAGREAVVAEGAVRMEAAVLEAQRLVGTDGVWAAVLEAERIRVEVEAETGVSLTEPLPERVRADALAWVARVTAEEAARFLEGTS